MSEPKILFSFFAGLLLGVSVFGVSIMGQGVWEAGRMWGEALCEGRQP